MDVPVLRGERVTLRPLEPSDLDALVEVIDSPAVREWWPESENHARVREGLDEDFGFAIEVDGELAGWLGAWEEEDPEYRHGGLDIMLAEPFQGRGLGPEALRLAIDWLVAERGHHRITIDPAAHNARAIRAYESVGFRRVGVMRRYERGPGGIWRDSLLMDLLAEELPPRARRSS